MLFIALFNLVSLKLEPGEAREVGSNLLQNTYLCAFLYRAFIHAPIDLYNQICSLIFVK